MDLISDLRLAVRGLRRAPGLLLVATLSLGVGIAAFTALGGTLDGIFRRPLPYDPDGTLVFVGTVQEGRGGSSSPSGLADFLTLRESAATVRLAAYRDLGVNLAGDPAEWVAARRVSGDFFPVMGVRAQAGRLLVREDEDAAAPDVVVLGHTLWQRSFDADPAVLGRTLTVDGLPLTVVGILPPDFEFGFDSPDLWLPLRPALEASATARNVNVVGRMTGGGLAATRAELVALAEGLARTRPDGYPERTFRANGVREDWFGGDAFQRGAAASLLAAALVLLIACVNVANLLLARGAGRAEEMAVRRALGAGRLRLVRQLLTEAVVLAAAAGGVGLLLAAAGLRGLVMLMPEGMPGAGQVTLDGRVLLLGVAVALGSVLLFGLVPALRTVGSGAHRLGTGSVRGAARGGGRLRSALVGAQLALAMVLLATTLLVLRSVDALRDVELGFRATDVAALDLNLPEARYPDEAALRQAVRELETALAAVPGVSTAGLGVGVPTRFWRSAAFRLAEDPIGAEPRSSFVRFATPSYLATLGVTPVRGRGLRPADDELAPRVVLVNELFARRHWADEDPIGKILHLEDTPVEVVGVLPDLREYGPAYPAQMGLYLPLAQWPSRAISVVMAGGSPATMLTAAREAVAAVDPTLAVHGEATLASIVMTSAEQFTALGKLLSVLGAAALLLAVVGVYGSTAYTVARRVPEFGVRMAVGADARAIRRLVLRDTLVVAGMGTAAGLLLAMGAARGIGAFLFGVGAADPMTFGGTVLLLVGISLSAAWLPARRAARVDPVAALRSD